MGKKSFFIGAAFAAIGLLLFLALSLSQQPQGPSISADLLVLDSSSQPSETGSTAAQSQQTDAPTDLSTIEQVPVEQAVPSHDVDHVPHDDDTPEAEADDDISLYPEDDGVDHED